MNQDTTAVPMGPICPCCGQPTSLSWLDDDGARHYRHEQTTTAPGPDECVVGTDPAVALLVGTLTSIDLRLAKACSVCGQPLPAVVLDFHPTKADCIWALRGRVEKLEKAVKFYADPVTWMIWTNHPEYPAKVEADQGKIAREALA